jgi:DNA-binding CsgD family transcriptional regulator
VRIRTSIPRVLVGRETELALIAGVVEAAESARGGAMIVLGDPGIGKTALLDAAAGAEARVIAARGLEAEAELPFSALAELIEPLIGGLDRLPAPQRAALESALALGAQASPDRFAACAGLHGLLCAAAAERPLLVLVDDAQWLDAASAECIAFAGRRLAGRPIGMLATSRNEDRSRFDATGFDRLELEPLPADAALELLRSRHAELSKPATYSILGAAAGNPLALIELPAALSEEQRAGEATIGSPLTPGERLRTAFASRLEPLDPAPRLALLVAAAAGSRALAPVVSACRQLGLDQSALEPAEARELVSISTDAVEFSHPLLRAVVYREAAADERRRAHSALAETVGEDERGWHLAAAATGPDEEAAATLERSAQRAVERGAPVVAADALELASRLSAEASERARRLIAAGRNASSGGVHARAARLLEQAVALDQPEHRGEAVWLLAMVSLYEAGNAFEAHRMLIEEAERLRSAEPVRAATLLADAAVAATVVGDCRLSLATAERARELLGEGGGATERAQVLSILGWSLTMRGEPKPGRELFAEVDRLLPEIDPFSPAAQSIAVALNSRIPSEEYERARDECGAIVAGCREAGMIGMLPFPMAVESDACHRLGDWDTADARSAEAVELARETGQRGPLAQALVIRVWLLAARGDERGSRAAAERALAIAEPAGFGAIRVFVLAGLGFLELGLGRVGAAIEALEEVAAITAEQGFEEPTLIPWLPDLVEALIEAGRLEDAARAASTLAEQAEHSEGPFARSLAARAEGLVASEFDPPFMRALELHERRPAPFERARTALAYGTRLTRADRRAEARERLRESLATFEELEAAPWAERARERLRAAGAVERQPVSDPDELTAQETRIALAVAKGATNREVAAELFLSPKTIEYHLGRVYRKVGIRSRTELAALVADGRLVVGTLDGAGKELTDRTR